MLHVDNCTFKCVCAFVLKKYVNEYAWISFIGIDLFVPCIYMQSRFTLKVQGAKEI